MRVSTAMGSIMASLLAGKLADSFLATGNGDITVYIPSNVGVTIRAQNEMADSTRRIAVDFPGDPGSPAGTPDRRGRAGERRGPAAADFRHRRHHIYQTDNNKGYCHEKLWELYLLLAAGLVASSAFAQVVIPRAAHRAIV